MTLQDSIESENISDYWINQRKQLTEGGYFQVNQEANGWAFNGKIIKTRLGD